MNKLELNREVNELKELYKNMEIEKNVNKILHRFVESLMKYVIKGNKYVYEDKQLVNRHGHGKTYYAKSAREIRFQKIYLPNLDESEALISNILWNCQLIKSEEKADFEVSIEVFTPEEGKKVFRYSFSIKDLVQYKKRLFMKTIDINYASIEYHVTAHHKEIKQLLETSLEKAMKDQLV